MIFRYFDFNFFWYIMLISAVTQSSLVDYPGKVACIVFTVWCNFRCWFCHNPECVIPEKIKQIKNDLIPENIFFNFLKSRIWFLDWVSICGGEPTLHSDLYDFVKKIKNLWFLVKLDTNWSNANIIEKLMGDNLVDYVAVDLKNPLDDYSNLVWIQIKKDFLESYEKILKLLLNSNIDYEYRSTLIKWFHNEEKIEKMSKYISWAKNYYLQNYKSWNTLKSDFDGRSFINQELIDFQKIASKYVKYCFLRT